MFKLLIVDDEPHIINGIKRLINWEQYGIKQIESATNFTQAKEIAFTFEPDIAIVDVRIGNSWGYNLIEKLTSLGLNTQYIMISGYDDFEFVRKSLLAGAKDYILKPIDKNKLEAIVKRIIINDFHGEIVENERIDNEIDPILNVSYNKFSKLTTKALKIIQSEYSNNINLKYVGDLFKMNSTYIGQVFLKETNMKFSDYLLAYRMYQAKNMIENSKEKISYIAYIVGYTHLNHFYTHFKAYYNISPKVLRERAFAESEVSESEDDNEDVS